MLIFYVYFLCYIFSTSFNLIQCHLFNAYWFCPKHYWSKRVPFPLLQNEDISELVLQPSSTKQNQRRYRHSWFCCYCGGIYPLPHLIPITEHPHQSPLISSLPLYATSRLATSLTSPRSLLALATSPLSPPRPSISYHYLHREKFA